MYAQRHIYNVINEKLKYSFIASRLHQDYVYSRQVYIYRVRGIFYIWWRF